MKKLASVLAAMLVCAPAWADSSITHIEMIPLHMGVNPVRDMMPGEDGAIIQSWRPSGSDKGYNSYLVTIGDNIVGVESHKKFLDSIRDEPRGGKNPILSVRFARGKMEGQNVFLLITAARSFESYQRPADPAPVYYDIYQLVANGDAGTTGLYFAPVSEIQSEKKYCNSDLALTKKFGFPLPDPYEGLNQDDGC